MQTSELIRFGESVDKNLGSGRVFPFVYSFVGPSEYVDGVRVSGDDWEIQKTVSTLASLQALGISVPNGRTVTYARKLDGDYHFKLKSIRYTVYKIFNDTVRIYAVGTETGVQYCDMWNSNQGLLLRSQLSVSLSLPSQQGRYVFGGDTTNQIQSPGDLLPIDVDVLSGNLYGQGQLRTPVLMPRNSTVLFKFTNHDTVDLADLYVSGAMIGVKVRI